MAELILSNKNKLSMSWMLHKYNYSTKFQIINLLKSYKTILFNCEAI